MRRKPNRLDHIGRRIQNKLDAASRKFKSRVKWQLFSATPRKFWDRRFTFRPRRAKAFYDEVALAFVRVSHDRIIEKAMARRAMGIDIVVRDADTGRRLHLTMGVAGIYGRCIDDAIDKLVDWTQRYGRDGAIGDDDSPSASEVLEIVVFVGKRR